MYNMIRHVDMREDVRNVANVTVCRYRRELSSGDVE